MACLAVSTVVAFADSLTGDEFPLIVCYLPSIMVICWVGQPTLSASLATGCSTWWLIDDFVILGHGTITNAELWTAATHFVFFQVVIGVLIRLHAALEREKALACTDGLTGLANSREFRDQANRELNRAQRICAPVSVVYLDCDNFKQVNDTRGHCEGDRLLKEVGTAMREGIRATDVAARMGGDEFAILMPSTTRDEAEVVVQRIRERLSSLSNFNEWPVTFSIGVIVYQSIPDSVDEMIRGADNLMYEVKRDQKDAVAYKLCV